MSLLTPEEAKFIEIPSPAWTRMCHLNDENRALKDALGDALRRADTAESAAQVYKECHESLVGIAKNQIPCPLCDSSVTLDRLTFAVEHVGREDTRKAAIEELGATEETMLHDLIHVPRDW